MSFSRLLRHVALVSRLFGGKYRLIIRETRIGAVGTLAVTNFFSPQRASVARYCYCCTKLIDSCNPDGGDPLSHPRDAPLPAKARIKIRWSAAVAQSVEFFF
jgi:hypothetical protein